MLMVQDGTDYFTIKASFTLKNRGEPSARCLSRFKSYTRHDITLSHYL